MSLSCVPVTHPSTCPCYVSLLHVPVRSVLYVPAMCPYYTSLNMSPLCVPLMSLLCPCFIYKSLLCVPFINVPQHVPAAYAAGIVEKSDILTCTYALIS